MSGRAPSPSQNSVLNGSNGCDTGMVWLHCYSCLSEIDGVRPFFVTQCGHTFCDRCLARATAKAEGTAFNPSSQVDPGLEQFCGVCSAGTMVAKLDEHLPVDILSYFKSPEEQIESTIKDYRSPLDQIEATLSACRFQKSSFIRLVRHLRTKLRDQQELLVRSSEEINRAKEARETLTSQYNALENSYHQERARREELEAQFSGFRPGDAASGLLATHSTWTDPNQQSLANSFATGSTGALHLVKSFPRTPTPTLGSMHSPGSNYHHEQLANRPSTSSSTSSTPRHRSGRLTLPPTPSEHSLSSFLAPVRGKTPSSTRVSSAAASAPRLHSQQSSSKITMSRPSTALPNSRETHRQSWIPRKPPAPGRPSSSAFASAARHFRPPSVSGSASAVGSATRPVRPFTSGMAALQNSMWGPMSGRGGFHHVEYV
ncbi:hypothetical protein M427DRAFT_55031 [Gonapodya prolifera JEL478]|uniref:RING-type domain-containing protein n=1 Tax=Gonapodya prolifera (strain JEL478) TaxID=1344416 RepID=A0A139AJY4_GONPJ|nr:hypothetical protein M427DRAFT_55031 [Gonapodya prolifera JEL478]|eukprot:KXS17008.1 hypothetical protein M427DRAFT_55031 [Gonapodya prolifera JEL478]